MTDRRTPSIEQAGHVFHSARDISNPERFHEAARTLREQDPVHWVEDPLFNPFYVVSKYEDVKAIGARSATMLNGPRAILGSKTRDEQVRQNGHLIKTLVHMDDPEHQAHRRLVSDWFKPKNLNAMQSKVDALAERAVVEMSGFDGYCDFAADVAMQYPLRVILSLLGLPESDYPRMLQLTQEIFGPDDPEFAIPFGQARIHREGSDATVIATHTYVQKALDAAEKLAAEGIDVEVIDPRTLFPG